MYLISYLKFRKMKFNSLEEAEKVIDYANRNIWNGVTLVINILDDLNYSCCTLKIKDKYKINLAKEAILQLNPHLILKDEKLKVLKNKRYDMKLTRKEIILTYDFRSSVINYKVKDLIKYS